MQLSEVLPKAIHSRLRGGFQEYGKKMRGYLTNEAVAVAVESRTSSPVRIPRNENGEHPQIKGLFPCGEGGGYAGGIVSAAIDGEKVSENIDHYPPVIFRMFWRENSKMSGFQCFSAKFEIFRLI